jgi:sugar phosphate isomerase/epimerase
MMLEIGVQTHNAIDDRDPRAGFELLKAAGFSCVDFSLDSYLKDKETQKVGHFFDAPIEELKEFFTPHRQAAAETGIRISQMHMPTPVYAPARKKAVNEYMWNIVVPKSLELCAFFRCPYIVFHGFKMAQYLGSEDLEWAETERFIEHIAPMAIELGITLCLENIYDTVHGHLIEGPGCNVHKAVERIDRINEKYGTQVLGFCFDTGHGNLVGFDFEEFLTTMGHRLKVLHIHDNDGRMDLHQLPFIRGLRSSGFDGVLSFETAPVLSSFPEELRGDVLRFIAAIGRYFSRKICDE